LLISIVVCHVSVVRWAKRFWSYYRFGGKGRRCFPAGSSFRTLRFYSSEIL
jgi:hypothetical protein